MSQTAKRFNLIDQEYIDFIQSLMSKTVTEPIAGLRASATEALAAPAGELMLAKEDLVRAAQNLDGRLTANLTRAVDTLESVSDELSGVGSRLDELVQEGNDRRQLVQQISVALEKLHLEISAGTETLTQARELAGRLSELQAGLEDRWPTFERSIYERWKTHSEDQEHSLEALRLETKARIETVNSLLGELSESLQRYVLASGDRLLDHLRADSANQAEAQLKAAERLEQLFGHLHLQWEKRFDEEARSSTEHHQALSLQLGSGFELLESGLQNIVRAEENLQSSFDTDSERRAQGLAEVTERLAALDSGQDRTVMHLESLDSLATQKAQQLEGILATIKHQLERTTIDATTSILSGLSHESGLVRQELEATQSQTSKQIGYLEQNLVSSSEQVAAKMLTADTLLQEISARLHQLLSFEQNTGESTSKKLGELEDALRIGRRFLLTATVLGSVALIAILLLMTN